MGGPQAGIILGQKALVESIRNNQLSRALRIDKLTLLALEETLRLYRDRDRAIKEIPTLKMIFQPYTTLVKKAGRLHKLIGSFRSPRFSLALKDGFSRTGGGALPLLELPSRLLCLVPKKMTAQAMEVWLRSYNPPVITRLEKETVLLDVRTIQEKELKIVAQAVKAMAES
jgi:L-seryl-tRNA(Ser) seleniumtransferase